MTCRVRTCHGHGHEHHARVWNTPTLAQPLIQRTLRGHNAGMGYWNEPERIQDRRARALPASHGRLSAQPESASTLELSSSLQSPAHCCAERYVEALKSKVPGARVPGLFYNSAVHLSSQLLPMRAPGPPQSHHLTRQKMHNPPTGETSAQDAGKTGN